MNAFQERLKSIPALKYARDAVGGDQASAMAEGNRGREALVELRGIRRTYGETTAVDTVDLSIERGEFVVLLGPSGSGKTTILSMIGGFVEPSAGTVHIDGRDMTHLPASQRPTVTVFQDYALFPHMNVETNVGFGLEMRGVKKAERRRLVAEALRLVGLEGYGARAIHQLSGGQRQRVALARAIAVRPAVLLLDEPLGALDLNLRRQMQEELVRLQKQLGVTFVHVTHDQEEAMNIADKIVVLNQGRIEDLGSPDRVYLSPATLFTATFMGESNILSATVSGQHNGVLHLRTPLASVEIEGKAAEGATLHLSLRPEHIKLEAPPGALSLGRVTIRDTVFQGAYRRCHAVAANRAETALLLRVPVEQSVHPGDQREVFVRREDLVLLAD